MRKVFVAIVCVMLAVLLSVNCCAMENIRRGQKSDAVRQIQELLISGGYLDGAADGIFGAKTEAAVLAFQKDKGLDATGIVGEATYKEMPEIARNIRAEMREAIDRKIADELECSRRTGSTSSMNCIQNTFRSRWRPTRTCSKPILS